MNDGGFSDVVQVDIPLMAGNTPSDSEASAIETLEAEIRRSLEMDDLARLALVVTARGRLQLVFYVTDRVQAMHRIQKISAD
jgi:hypothetical protein